MNNTLIIFSSSKSIHIAKRIKNNLDGVFIATIWTDGFFDGSNLPPVWTFLKNLMCYDFAAIVLGADDIMELSTEPHLREGANEKETVRIPKDNVVFELGAVMARIGPQKTFIFKPKELKVKIPSYFDASDPAKIKEGSGIESITTFVEYNNDGDLESIDKACEVLINKMLKMNRQDKFHSDLPSQGLAYGYANNFILPVCRKLFRDESDKPCQTYILKDNTTVEWLPEYGFTVSILVPSQILKIQEVIPQIESILGYKPESTSIIKKIEGNTDRPSGVFTLPRKDEKSPLHILDIPTTLDTSLKVIHRIDEYWLRDNSPDFISKLEGREVSNFHRALEQICSENSIISKCKVYVVPLNKLAKHVKLLDSSFD